MGILWLSARAEYILKCNMIPSLLLLFLPPWLFFTVFKGTLLLSARPSVPAFPATLCSRSLLTTCSPLFKSSNNLSSFLERVTSASGTHVPLCCLLAAPPARPQPRGLSWAPGALPRAISTWCGAERCSSVCQHHCCLAWPGLAWPDPVHWVLVLWAVTSQSRPALSSHCWAGLSCLPVSHYSP